MADNRATIRLSCMLAAKRVISMDELEVMRHLHLLDFDRILETAPNAVARAAIDESRHLLDGEWSRAIQIAQRAEPPKP